MIGNGHIDNVDSVFGRIGNVTGQETDYPIMGQLTNIKNEIFVNKNRIDPYVEDGSFVRPYKTIMAAINKIIALADNSWTNQYRISISSGVYAENIILENTALYAIEFVGEGFRKTVIQPASGNALQSTINNDNLAWLTFTDIWFAKGVNLTGENSNQYLGYNMFFRDCYFTGGAVLFKNLSYPTFWGNTRLNGAYTLTFSNCGLVTFNPYTEIGSSVTSFIVETDQTAGVKIPKEWTTGTRLIFMGCSCSKDPTWSLINITTYTGTAIQFRWARFGNAGCTIPVNASILVYFGTLVGSYINNGTLSIYGGAVTGTLTNNATLNLYQATDMIKNNSSITGTSLKDVLNNIYGILNNTAKIKFSPEGGLLVLYINKTGANSIKGYVVRPSSTTIDGVDLSEIDSVDPIGYFYESGVADGQYAWVVVAGRGEIYCTGNVALRNFIRVCVAGDPGAANGQAFAETAPSPPLATDKHFREIAHAMASRTGAGLVMCDTHKN